MCDKKYFCMMFTFLLGKERTKPLESRWALSVQQQYGYNSVETRWVPHK